MQLQMKTQTL